MFRMWALIGSLCFRLSIAAVLLVRVIGHGELGNWGTGEGKKRNRLPWFIWHASFLPCALFPDLYLGACFLSFAHWQTSTAASSDWQSSAETTRSAHPRVAGDLSPSSFFFFPLFLFHLVPLTPAKDHDWLVISNPSLSVM